MGRPAVGMARLRVVPEKADGRPGGRDHRRSPPGSVDRTLLEVRESEDEVVGREKRLLWVWIV